MVDPPRTPPRHALLFIEDGSFTLDNRVKHEAAALRQAGWEVTVICPKYRDDPFHRTTEDGTEIFFYPKPNAASPVTHLVEHAFTLFFGALLVGLVHARRRVTVFHACNPLDILWLFAIPLRWGGARFVFDQHDLCPELYLSRQGARAGDFWHRALLWLEARSYAAADVVIATNGSYRDVAVRRGHKAPASVFVVRNGPDPRLFRRVAPRPGLKRDGEILVGYLGNMNEQDGVDIILEMAARLRRQGGSPVVRFVLVGGGSSSKRLRAQCQADGLSDVVTFTGRLPDDDMLATLCACDICLQPDPSNPLNDASTMNKVMEYMSLGVPVASFDLKETRVSCGDIAVYAAPGDLDGLIACVLRLAGDPDLRRRLGDAGRERVETTLAWQHSVPHLLAAYAAVDHVART